MWRKGEISKKKITFMVTWNLCNVMYSRQIESKTWIEKTSGLIIKNKILQTIFFTFDPLSKLYSFHFCAFWQLHKNHWYHSQKPWHFESLTLNRNNCEARISPQEIFHDFLVACIWVIARIRSFPIKNIWGIGDSGQPQIVGYLHISTNTPPS